MVLSRRTLLITILLLTGCATIAVKSRMDDFTTTAKRYERALLMSDFSSAYKFLDPSLQKPDMDFRPYADVKLSRYQVTAIKVSQDHNEVLQDVQLEYFLLNRNILRTIPYRQEWRYDETRKAWILHTGLPAF
jgi:hypothetical protein